MNNFEKAIVISFKLIKITEVRSMNYEFLIYFYLLFLIYILEIYVFIWGFGLITKRQRKIIMYFGFYFKVVRYVI